MAEETIVTAPAAPLPTAIENEVIQRLTAALSSQYGQALTDLVVTACHDRTPPKAGLFPALLRRTLQTNG